MKRIQNKISTKDAPLSHANNNHGFTLVELMIALAVGALVMTAVMTSFISQHRSYLAQDDVVEMQQNGRAAMDMLTRDIRSAGYDPNDLGAGIITAGANKLEFTREDDLATNGLETIEYTLFDSFVGAGNDGLDDDLAMKITTAAGNTGGRQTVAENISQLEFRYLDENGEITANLGAIRSIIVAVLATASQPDPNFTNNMVYTYTYTSPLNINTIITWPAFNDNRRRDLFVSIIKCRNVGL